MLRVDTPLRHGHRSSRRPLRTRRRCGFCYRLMPDRLVREGRIYCHHADCRKARMGLV